MRAMIMKVGTMPLASYDIFETRNIRGCELSIGQKIKFRPQFSVGGSRIRWGCWENGIITDIKIDIPFVDRF